MIPLRQNEYESMSRKAIHDTLMKHHLETGRIIAEMYKELSIGRESKIRQALIDEGWTPPTEATP